VVVDRDKAERRKVIKNKILAVGRISHMFSVLREESERVSELKSISGSSRLPYGTLALGAEGIKNAIKSFDDARKSDIDNERLPPSPVEARVERPPPQPPHTSSSPSPSLGLGSTNAGTAGTVLSTGKGIISPGPGVGVGIGATTNAALGLPPGTPFRRRKEGILASAQRR